MLAARAAHSVSLAIALAASLSACEASTYADAPPAAAPLEKPESNVDPKADTAGHRGQRGAMPAGLSTASRDEGTHDSTAQTDASAGASHMPRSPPQEVAADIARFIPDDTMVRMEKRGDLDGDGDQDVLLVLQEKTQAESAPRTLTILRGAADGSFEKVIENPNAILCQSCGGMMGDPLSDIEIHAGGFVLAFEGGSRELWSRTYGFAYSKSGDDWQLERIGRKVLDRIDGHQEDSHATREQIGAVSIKDFDAALMAQDSDT